MGAVGSKLIFLRILGSGRRNFGQGGNEPLRGIEYGVYCQAPRDSPHPRAPADASAGYLSLMKNTVMLYSTYCMVETTTTTTSLSYIVLSLGQRTTTALKSPKDKEKSYTTVLET